MPRESSVEGKTRGSRTGRTVRSTRAVAAVAATHEDEVASKVGAPVVSAGERAEVPVAAPPVPSRRGAAGEKGAAKAAPARSAPGKSDLSMSDLSRSESSRPKVMTSESVKSEVMPVEAAQPRLSASDPVLSEDVVVEIMNEPLAARVPSPFPEASSATSLPPSLARASAEFAASGDLPGAQTASLSDDGASEGADIKAVAGPDTTAPVTGEDVSPRRALWVWWCVVLVLCAGSVLAGLVPPLLALILGMVSLGPLLLVRSRPAPLRAPASSVPEPTTRRDTRVQALVAALPEPALLLTAHGDIVTANARVALALGPARVGDPLSFVVRVPEVLEAVRAAAADGLPRRVEFAERVPHDRWLEAHVVPLHLDPASPGRGARTGGGSDAVLLTFRDLTHQRRVEQMRADFVANASHELRTPLASLSGFIETLQGPARNDADARERFLGIMAVQARRMSRLIDDLLSLSRIELHVHVQPETEVDLRDILNHVCDALSPLAQDRGVTIEQACTSGQLMVRGDRDELIRLLENLVENALKYGASGERITVRVDREETDGGAVAVVSVQDYGPGIPPEHLPRLTERFYRVNVAASRGQGGTGLGLAIVKHIVARHRGRMSIESVHGEGATFAFRLDVLPDNKKIV